MIEFRLRGVVDGRLGSHDRVGDTRATFHFFPVPTLNLFYPQPATRPPPLTLSLSLSRSPAPEALSIYRGSLSQLLAQDVLQRPNQIHGLPKTDSCNLFLR
jgi:hypothetical protein